MGFISYCLSLSLYIMSSCLMRYSVLMNLILQMHAGQQLMCGVIVVDAGRSRSIVTDVMPIYMIMPRYSHNYALFYQLLDNNLFTHRNTYAILREATSETYGPRVSFSSYQSPSLYYSFCFYFIYFASLYQKYQKIYYLSSLSDLTFVSDREGIDDP